MTLAHDIVALFNCPVGSVQRTLPIPVTVLMLANVA